MIDWTFVLAPLAVLPIALLFRFAGCAHFSAADDAAIERPPRYRDFIMGVANNPGTVPHPDVKPSLAAVVAYWRLVDDAASNLAKDEKGFQNGAYVITPQGLPAISSSPDSGGSEAAPGTFVTGQTGLISSDPAMCRFFNGGYVSIPAKDGLYTDEFTLEAWVEAQWGPTTTGFEHVLFDAGGHYRLPYTIEPPAYHGFRIFADRNNRWQARLSPDMLPVFSDPPLVPRSGRTYVALSVQKDGGGYKATVFVNGQLATTGRVGAYSRPDGAPLMIAIGNNASPDGPVAPRYPLIARVQEVVLYGKALSKEEVENHFALNPNK